MRLVAAVWGVLGVASLLSFAIVRLTPNVLEAMAFNLQWYHWLALLASVVFMAYSEGYRGFQKGFSPRVAARARVLHSEPVRRRYLLLSPIFCASYIHATRRRRISAYVVTAMIFVLVLMVGHLAQPWRGIVDAGVVVGLLWGLVSLVVYSFQALTADEFSVSPDLPER